MPNNSVKYEIKFSKNAVKEIKKYDFSLNEFRELLLYKLFTAKEAHKLKSSIQFQNGFSTPIFLYSVDIKKDLRAIVTNDIDEIHDIRLICVYTLCKHDNYNREIESVLKTIGSEN